MPLESRHNAASVYDEALDKFTDYLKKNSLKITRERRLILKELIFANSHLDAEELLIRLRKKNERVSRATIYRTFDLLTKADLIARSDLGHNHFHYEKSIGKERHDHMICNATGTVIEFSDKRLDALLEEICEAHGFTMENRTLQIFGTVKDGS